MTVDEVIEYLVGHDEISESYVLVNSLKVYLNVGHECYRPCVKIKIYKSSILSGMPYHFEASHHVHTPTQATPYRPSRTSFGTEEEAIMQAIGTTTSFLKSAVRAGHEPQDSWLVLNDSF